MNTQQLIISYFDTTDWSYEVDRFDGDVITGFGLACEGRRYPVHLILTPEPASIRVRSPLMAGSGGPDGEFDPLLAGFVATLAYAHDLHLGVDLRDGEIEARLTVELAGVDPDLQRQVFQRALSHFLMRLSLVTRFLLRFHQELDGAGKPSGVDGLLDDAVDLSA